MPAPELPSIYSGATPTPELPSIYDTGRAPAPVPEIPSIYSGEGAMPQLPDIYTTGAADAAAANLARSMTNTSDFALPDTNVYRPELPPEVSGVDATVADRMPAVPPEVSGIQPTSPAQSYADLMAHVRASTYPLPRHHRLRPTPISWANAPA